MIERGAIKSLQPPINADETRMFSIGVNQRASAVAYLVWSSGFSLPRLSAA
jgi:hypothetical protein